MHSRIVDSCCSAKSINSSLSRLVVLSLDHLVDISELIIDLFQDNFVLVIEHSLVFFHLDIDMFDPFQLLLQHSHVILVISGDINY